MPESTKRFSDHITFFLKRMRGVASAYDRQQDLPDFRASAIRIGSFASRGMKSWQDRQTLLLKPFAFHSSVIFSESRLFSEIALAAVSSRLAHGFSLIVRNR